ncbi:MBL fold metallo-hydrolase [Poseidonibacter lekithochrous]|uniref:MBL fold metallo-hydrolase n=1 Tax=Poseidonibacter lekithochrous TaxID=1904463 RepID=UPI0008FC99DC|nr:MBL fold metallo-hydrolase [Poseidonibacter lekithochrous]QKJ23817.1 hypothetical protein ALEK_2572 [Poseidonibacter lekithochrous]
MSSIVKSFSVGNGDMFYIKHTSNNFTIIDSFLKEDNKVQIVEEIKEQKKDKGISRFISTHPDEDHIKGLEYLNEHIGIEKFYCVENKATKVEQTTDFGEYCDLRDSDKSYFIYKNCKRKWMNESSDERGSSGVHILWPDTSNNFFKNALEKAKDGDSPNNLSPIIKYHSEGGVKFLWMGDLETEFMLNIESSVNMPDIDILFAPHHGRKSGKIPESWLKEISPKLVIIGEAPSEHLNYYKGYNTITQNSAGEITFESENNKVHIYVSNQNYSVRFLDDEKKANTHGYYIGTLIL